MNKNDSVSNSQRQISSPWNNNNLITSMGPQ